jgi:predicted transcriptional regulator
MLFQEFENIQAGEVILLSIKPRFAQQIVSGHKRVEFRRRWPSRSVSAVVIYSSAPVQKIVAVATIDEIVERTPRALWNYAKDKGAGLCRAELMEYLSGKTAAYAASLTNVKAFKRPVALDKLFSGVSAPQSFRYLNGKEISKVLKMIDSQGV